MAPDFKKLGRDLVPVSGGAWLVALAAVLAIGLFAWDKLGALPGWGPSAVYVVLGTFLLAVYYVTNCGERRGRALASTVENLDESFREFRKLYVERADPEVARLNSLIGQAKALRAWQAGICELLAKDPEIDPGQWDKTAERLTWVWDEFGAQLSHAAGVALVHPQRPMAEGRKRTSHGGRHHIDIYEKVLKAEQGIIECLVIVDAEISEREAAVRALKAPPT